MLQNKDVQDKIDAAAEIVKAHARVQRLQRLKGQLENLTWDTPEDYKSCETALNTLLGHARALNLTDTLGLTDMDIGKIMHSAILAKVDEAVSAAEVEVVEKVGK